MSNEQVKHSFKTSYGINPEQLYWNFDPDLKKPKIEAFENIKKRHIYAKIFRYMCGLVLEDIIENNVVYDLGTTGTNYWEMGIIEGDSFKSMRQCGALMEFDFLKTNYRAYRLQYRYNIGKKTYIKYMYVGNKLKNKIIEQANKGRVY